MSNRGKPALGPPVRVARLAAMSSGEPGVEAVSERCEECGMKLTATEMQTVLESGGPTLCAVHALEDEPGLAAEETTDR